MGSQWVTLRYRLSRLNLTIARQLLNIYRGSHVGGFADRTNTINQTAWWFS